MTSIVRVVDFETAGLPEQEGAAICEAGWCDVIGDIIDDTTGLRHWRVDADRATSYLCNPGHPIPPEIRAVHHISDKDVAGAPPPRDILEKLSAGEVSAFAAHVAKFERAFFDLNEARWICTYKVALRLYPDAPSHSNQALRYLCGLELDPDAAMPPHRAGPDAFVTAHLLAHMLNDGRASIDDMVRWSSGPALLSKVTFGKHKGSKWEDLPTDYLEWLLYKSDMDADTKANAKHHILKRQKK